MRSFFLSNDALSEGCLPLNFFVSILAQLIDYIDAETHPYVYLCAVQNYPFFQTSSYTFHIRNLHCDLSSADVLGVNSFLGNLVPQVGQLCNISEWFPLNG